MRFEEVKNEINYVISLSEKEAKELYNEISCLEFTKKDRPATWKLWDKLRNGITLK